VNTTMKVRREVLQETNLDTLEIVRAAPAGEYKIHLWFNDGKNHIVDFEVFLNGARNPMVKKYRDLKKFQKFQLDHGNLQWNDYEMCFDIEDLYYNDVAAELDGKDRQKLEEVARQFQIL